MSIFLTAATTTLNSTGTTDMMESVTEYVTMAPASNYPMNSSYKHLFNLHQVCSMVRAAMTPTPPKKTIAHGSDFVLKVLRSNRKESEDTQQRNKLAELADKADKALSPIISERRVKHFGKSSNSSSTETNAKDSVKSPTLFKQDKLHAKRQRELKRHQDLLHHEKRAEGKNAKIGSVIKQNKMDKGIELRIRLNSLLSPLNKELPPPLISQVDTSQSALILHPKRHHMAQAKVEKRRRTQNGSMLVVPSIPFSDTKLNRKHHGYRQNRQHQYQHQQHRNGPPPTQNQQHQNQRENSRRRKQHPKNNTADQTIIKLPMPAQQPLYREPQKKSKGNKKRQSNVNVGYKYHRYMNHQRDDPWSSFQTWDDWGIDHFATEPKRPSRRKTRIRPKPKTIDDFILDYDSIIQPPPPPPPSSKSASSSSKSSGSNKKNNTYRSKINQIRRLPFFTH